MRKKTTFKTGNPETTRPRWAPFFYWHRVSKALPQWVVVVISGSAYGGERGHSGGGTVLVR